MEKRPDQIGEAAAELQGLKDRDPAAIERLWADYFQRLVALARKHLPRDSRRDSDEEDVALSAFQCLCDGAASGQFPKLDDREDLWRLLVVITLRKARRVTRRGQSQKRGGLRASGERAPGTDANKHAPRNLAELLGEGPTPALAAEVAEECERLLGQLGDPQLRSIALMKMEGYTVGEIAQQLSMGTRSVERGLHSIRAKWSAALSHQE